MGEVDPVPGASNGFYEDDEAKEPTLAPLRMLLERASQDQLLTLLPGDRRPVVLVGDGAFQMTGMELATSLRYGLSPIVVILNNAGYTTERLMIVCNARTICDPTTIGSMPFHGFAPCVCRPRTTMRRLSELAMISTRRIPGVGPLLELLCLLLGQIGQHGDRIVVADLLDPVPRCQAACSGRVAPHRRKAKQVTLRLAPAVILAVRGRVVHRVPEGRFGVFAVPDHEAEARQPQKRCRRLPRCATPQDRREQIPARCVCARPLPSL